MALFCCCCCCWKTVSMKNFQPALITSSQFANSSDEQPKWLKATRRGSSIAWTWDGSISQSTSSSYKDLGLIPMLWLSTNFLPLTSQSWEILRTKSDPGAHYIRFRKGAVPPARITRDQCAQAPPPYFTLSWNAPGMRWSWHVGLGTLA